MRQDPVPGHSSPNSPESSFGLDVFGSASLPAGHRTEQLPESTELYQAQLIHNVRDHVQQLSRMTESGNGRAGLTSLIESACAVPSDADLEGNVNVEGARVLLRIVGDPGLIVQSRGFIPLVGLSDSVAIDKVARSIHQHGEWDRATKDLLENLPTYTPSELDQSLPPLSPCARELLIEPAHARFRELPGDSGMADRLDDTPHFRRLVEKRGVGARSFDLPEGVGVKPPEPIRGKDLLKVKEVLALVDTYRADGPRILSSEEIAVLSEGRRAPSRSQVQGQPVHLDEHAVIASAINDWVREGVGFEFDLVQSLSTKLAATSNPDTRAGRLRSFENCIQKGGEAVFFAPSELLLAYLDDLKTWHDANQDTMHPVVCAALTYQQVVRVHPLPDGNGRVGRALMDCMLQSNGYLPPTFTDIDERTITDRSAQVVQRVAKGILNSASLLEH
jgi:hypothetical protein